MASPLRLRGALELGGELLVPEVVEAAADHADEACGAAAKSAGDGVRAKADARGLGPNAGLGLGGHPLAAQGVRHAGRREPRGLCQVAQRGTLASGGRLRHDVC